MLNNIYHQFARHAELSRSEKFLIWLKVNGCSYWYDTPVGGDDSSLYRLVSTTNETTL